MSVRNIFGFTLLLAGVVIQPAGWMYTHWLTAVSFATIVAGVLMLYVERRQESASAGGGTGLSTGRDMPGDVHGHSGQYSGGRSTGWESGHSSNGDGGSGGD
jgi:hypothetical protein